MQAVICWESWLRAQMALMIQETVPCKVRESRVVGGCKARTCKNVSGSANQSWKILQTWLNKLITADFEDLVQQARKIFRICREAVSRTDPITFTRSPQSSWEIP